MKRTILIADDSATIRQALRQRLERAGFRVQEAGNGIDAVRMAYQTRPDAVVLDLMMPRMNGYQVCRLLKADPVMREIPVVILSMLAQPKDRFWGLEVGAARYLMKTLEGRSSGVRYIGKGQSLERVVTALRRLTEGSTQRRASSPQTPMDADDVLTRVNELLDQRLFEATLVNRIHGLVNTMEDQPRTLRCLFRTLARVIDFQAAFLLARQGARFHLYYWARPTAGASWQHELSMRSRRRWKALTGTLPDVRRVDLEMIGSVSRRRSSSSPLGGAVFVPLRSRGMLVGLLGLAADRSDAFSADTEDALAVVSPALATVVDNAVLYHQAQATAEALEDEVRRLSVLLGLSRQMLLSENFDELLDHILSQCVEAVGAEGGSLMLLDEQRKHLVVTRSIGKQSDRLLGAKIPVGQRVAGWVAKRGEPQLLVERLDRHPAFRGVQPFRPIRSSMVVPLVIKRLVIGVMSLNRWVSTLAFSQKDLTMATTIANYAAMSLEKSRLYERLATSYRKLQAVQASLVQSEKLATLGQIAAAIAHEINNPLSVISSRAQLLLMDEGKDSPRLEGLQQIVAQTQRASNIISRLLAFSRPPKGAEGLADVPRAFEEALEVVRYQIAMDKIRVVREIAEKLPPVVGSQSQIQEVLVNLIVNAGQAMPDGGTLRLSAKLKRGKPPVVRLECGDTGMGISREHQPRIFEPFFTMKQYGTGLGLFVVRQIINAIGGTILVNSRVGQGTTFVIELPLVSTKAA